MLGQCEGVREVVQGSKVDVALIKSSILAPFASLIKSHHPKIVTVSRRRSTQPSQLSLICFGRARARNRVRDRDITIGYYGSGDLVGEESLFGHPPPELYALESLELLTLPETCTTELLKQKSFVGSLLKQSAERRRLAEDRLTGLLTQPVEARLVHFLLQAATRHGIPSPAGVLIGTKFTHLEIASYVGATRETVTLVLGELKRAGLITTDHRRIVIKDRARLSTRADLA